MSQFDNEQSGAVLAAPEPTGLYTAADHGLSDAAREAVRRGVPQNTASAYLRQWHAFTRWCEASTDPTGNHAPRVPLPATADTITEYVTALAATLVPGANPPRTYGLDHINQALAAIAFAHKRDRVPMPDTTDARLVMRGYARDLATAGHARREAPPILMPELRAMGATCDLDTPAGARDRVLLLFGHSIYTRVSDIAGLRNELITPFGSGFQVRITQSKTDTQSRGRTVQVGPGARAATDPITALKAWRAHLELREQPTAGYLIRPVKGHGHIQRARGPMSEGSVNDIIRRVARQAGLANPDQYTCHSLRSGGAVSAFMAGVPIAEIARRGGWSPESPVLLRYLRMSQDYRYPMEEIGY